MNFSEYCELIWEKELPDWQKDILDKYYEGFKNRSIDTTIYISRKNARTSFALGLSTSLCLYLDYLEENKIDG